MFLLHYIFPHSEHFFIANMICTIHFLQHFGCQGIALRGLFIIDKEGIIQHSTINNLAIGRSVDETMRTLQVIIFYWYRNQLKSHLDAVGTHPTTWPPHIQWVLRVEF